MKDIAFSGKEDTYKELKALLLGQGIKVQDFFNQAMENHIIKYKDKPHSLDSFIENPEYREAPPFPFLKGDIDRTKWVKHLQFFIKDEKYMKKLEWDNQTLGALIRKMQQYGTVNVHD